MIDLVSRTARGCRAILAAWALVFALVGPCGAQSGPDNVRRFELRIENGRLTDTRKVITVRRGDVVELAWQADRRTIVHLHGYDIEITIAADKPEVMRFSARATGRFPIETHPPSGQRQSGRHTVLIHLEVHPR